MAFSIGLYLSSSAYAIKPENVNDLAESIVQSMKYSNTDPGFKRGVIQEIHPLMRVNASILKGIRQFGLLNQHQTGTSEGVLNPSYRSSLENRMQGLDQLGLATANPTELYPKYGYMNYKTDGKELARQSSGTAADGYGNVILVFKQGDPKLLSRITYSLRDSIGPVPVYPLNNLVPLEKYQKGIVGGGSYRELQYWGTLDLNDVQEIWLTGSLFEENKKTLKEIAQTYGLPVYETDENQGSDYEHLQLTRKRDADLSGTVRSEARPFKQMSGAELIEYHKKVIEPDLNSSDYSKKSQAKVGESIVTSLLAERGQVKDLPPQLEKEVQNRIEESRKSLMTLATGNNVFPRVRASALHALLDETWSSPWLTQSEYRKIVPYLFDERVLNELENRYYKSASSLVAALRKHIPGTEKGIDFTPVVASYLIPPRVKTREAGRTEAASLEILEEALGSGTLSDPHPVLTTLSTSAANDAERVSKFLPFLDSKNETVRKVAAETLAQAIPRLAPNPGLRAQLETLRGVLGSQAAATIEKTLKEKGFSANDAIDADKLLQGDNVTLLRHLIDELEAVKAAQPVAPESCPL